MTKIRTLIYMFLFSTFIINSFNSCAKKPKSTLEILDSNAPYDVIIVPGVPYDDDYWTKILMSRIYWSYYLHSNGYAKNIIYSGSAVYTPYVEAKIMAMYAKEMGIPETNIFTETNAEHSVENVFYSYKLARKLGFKKIALATDPFQSKMMQGPSKRMKVNIDFVPFSIEILDTMKIIEHNITDEKAYVENFISIEERENFFQRLRGTLGKNVKNQ